MRPSVIFPIRPGIRLLALGAVALSASACSQTDRFAYDPFSNPFNGKEAPAYTGTVSSAPTGAVSSQPLPPPGGGYQPSSYTAASAYAPQQQPSPAYQQQNNYQPAAYTPPPRQPAQPAQFKYSQQAGWSAQGGQTVTVQPGDTVYALGMRHGIPASAIVQANNLPAGAALTPGQRIVIPTYHKQGQASQRVAAAPRAPEPKRHVEQDRDETPRVARASSGGSHTVEPGETLYSIARTYDVSPRDLAAANNVDLTYHVRSGESFAIPGEGARVQTAVSRPAQDNEPKLVKPVYKPEEDEPVSTPVVATAPQQQRDEYEAPPSPARAATGGTDFRWPVRGRVISAFGAKPNGQTNDGVNISVPEGTVIKAAEGGVVAYAGNELKGFGNLVLIRHSGDWVTAYAHASEIMVKRGDVVRRGQPIAKAGRTGNVTAPQLHFEVRRGASPVDPMDHLPRG